MRNPHFDSGLGIFDGNRVSSKRKLHIIYHVNSCTVYNFSLAYILGTILQKFGCDIVGYTITGLYLSGLICITLVRVELKRNGIDSSNAPVASRPTRETTET